VSVEVAGTQIVAVETVPERPDVPYLLPVLVDMQQNGAFGIYYHQLAERGVERLQDVADLLRRHGVGRVQLTIPTYDLAKTAANYRLLDRVLAEDKDLATLYFGFFHEGNFMSPQDGWRGAHMRHWIVPPDYDQFRELDDASGGRIRTVNVAPEEPGGLDFVARAAEAGKVVGMGHCCPDAETVAEAVARGARWVTHFGNGAAPQIHRFRNPFWSFMAHPELILSVICDGFHLPPDVVKAAMACREPGGCIPVSDASPYSGSPPGHYDEHGGGHPFDIEPNGFIHLSGSELLHGAWFQQDRCVEWLVQNLGLSLPEAWARCSEQPAAVAGLELPRIEPDQEASFVLAHWDDGLVIDQAVHNGKPYLDSPCRPTDC
jgi:N-acetylglucosamine-6-phosphate deacetylase